MKEKYIVVVEDSSAIELVVNAQINDGYWPIGGIVHFKGRLFMQAMVLKEEKEEEKKQE